MIKLGNKYMHTNLVKPIKDFVNRQFPIKLRSFYHDITYGDGDIDILTNDLPSLDFYETTKHPAVCTDQNGRTLLPGVYFKKHLHVSSLKDDAVLKTASSQLDIRNSLHFVEHSSDCQQMYSFVFNQAEDDFTFFVLNHMNAFHQFIDKYNLFFAEQLSKLKKAGEKLKLPISSDILLKNITPHNRVLKHLASGQLYPLSPQQYVCMQLLFQGKLVKKIASDMELSVRTVQHYIEHVREKLACPSINKLILDYEIL